MQGAESFYDAGGNSLLAGQLTAKLQDLGFELTVLDLFEHVILTVYLTQAGPGGWLEITQTSEGPVSAVSKRNSVIKLKNHFAASFEIYGGPYRAKKKCEHFSSPEKKMAEREDGQI